MSNITDDHVRELEELFASGNRAEFYWRYYELSGVYQSVIQAMITTYSGVWGGMAATGNYFAKLNRPDLYTVQLDEFSKHIAQSTLDSIKEVFICKV